MDLIRSVACLHAENNKILCVRTKGKDKFYISGINVEMQCFFAQYRSSISENSEIEEIKWVGSEFKVICAPAAQLAIEFLVKHNKIRI